jgi:hypothetical protein
MEGAVALVLALLSIPFILPLVSYLMARKLRGRVDDLEARIAQQDDQIVRLSNQLNKLKQEGVARRGRARADAAGESVGAGTAADREANAAACTASRSAGRDSGAS